MKKTILFGLFLLTVFIVSCAPQEPKISECDRLSLRFDNLAEKGCFAVNVSEDNTVVATLTEISSPSAVYTPFSTEKPERYSYKLTFRGKEKEGKFNIATLENITIENLPYKVGQNYKFDFMTLCGAIFSSGPYQATLTDDNFTALNIIKC